MHARSAPPLLWSVALGRAGQAGRRVFLLASLIAREPEILLATAPLLALTHFEAPLCWLYYLF